MRLRLFCALRSVAMMALGGLITLVVTRVITPPTQLAAQQEVVLSQQPDDPQFDRIVDVVDFEYEKLSDVIREFAQTQKLDITCKWDSLKQGRGLPDQFITLRLHKARVRDVLDQIMAAASPDGGAGWLDNHGSIKIGWNVDLDNTGPVVDRVYDISLVMLRSQRFTLRFPERPSRNSWVESGMSVVVPGTTPVENETTQIDEIALIITRSIAETSWRDNGGDIGTFSYLGNGKMLIHQTENNHRKIARPLSTIANDS